MYKLFAVSLLLFAVNQNVADENLIITHNNEPISSVSRDIFTLTYPGFLFINNDVLQELVEKVDKMVSKIPANAKLDENGKIIPEDIGYKLNQGKFMEEVYNYYYGQGRKEINVPIQTIYPKVDSELLSQIKVQQIGQYITFYNPHNAARTQNILLATKSINNQVLFPGETFSFNKVVGRRTTNKGYLPAPIIVRGELSEGVGGGICQVSSTLYNAVDNAGMVIVKRYSHSKSVPYVPPGRDATVSWFGPDFSFKNVYNQPIIIRAISRHGKMIVRVYSSDAVNYKKRKVPSASKLLFQKNGKSTLKKGHI